MPAAVFALERLAAEACHRLLSWVDQKEKKINPDRHAALLRSCLLGHPGEHQAEPALRNPSMWNIFIPCERPMAAKNPALHGVVIRRCSPAGEP